MAKLKGIVFCLEDVLAPFKLGCINELRVKEVLENIREMEKKKELNAFLVSALSREKANLSNGKTNVTDYFKKENMFFVDQDYINSKEKVDRELLKKNLEKNPLFEDDYFKQFVLEKLFREKRLDKKNSMLICHDILLDGYYSAKFSEIKTIFLKESISFKNQKLDSMPHGMHSISMDWKEFRELIEGKKKLNDDTKVKEYALNALKKEMMNYLSKELAPQMAKLSNKKKT